MPMVSYFESNRTYSTYWTYPAFPLYRLAVIDRLLALFQSYVGLLPRRLATFKPTPASRFPHKVDRANAVYFDLKDRFYIRLNLRFARGRTYPECTQLL